MLQQTQVSRVLEKYPRFIKRFPSFAILANARMSSVIREWMGMGYNNRAVRLQQLANIVVSQYRGKLPNSITELQLLPGVGKYTAHAIAYLVHNHNVPIVDTNVKRVLTRVFPAKARKLDIWDLAASILPARRAQIWNQALMDLGATICTALSPKCGVCPISNYCPSAFKNHKVDRQQKLPEPSRDGVPNRIYRGRIVDVLRNSGPNRFISLNRIGRQIKGSFSTRDEGWLSGLVRDLEQDGLVTLKHTARGIIASLPQ